MLLQMLLCHHNFISNWKYTHTQLYARMRIEIEKERKLQLLSKIYNKVNNYISYYVGILLCMYIILWIIYKYNQNIILLISYKKLEYLKKKYIISAIANNIEYRYIIYNLYTFNIIINYIYIYVNKFILLFIYY